MTQEFLDLLVRDQESAPLETGPGPYWTQKSWSARRSLNKHGLQGFRSSCGPNVAALSYGDAHVTDVRLTLGRSLGARLALYTIHSTPLRRLFERQVELTQSQLVEKEAIARRTYQFAHGERLSYLLETYEVNNSVNYGCTNTLEFRGSEYSVHYLSLLDQIDRVEQQLSLGSSISFLEIGPGFGATTHLVEQNYPNIRKYLLVDIAPNIYLLTEYLRSIYGNSVIDYKQVVNSDCISFTTDDSLEIIVIPPWKLKDFQGSMDYCWNSHSFVEMRPEAVAYYSQQLARLSNIATKYAFITYDQFDVSVTIDPHLMVESFDSIDLLKHHQFETLFDPARANLFFLSQSPETTSD